MRSKTLCGSAAAFAGPFVAGGDACRKKNEVKKALSIIEYGAVSWWNRLFSFLRLRTPKVAHFVFEPIFSLTFLRRRVQFWQRKDKYDVLKMKTLQEFPVSEPRLCLPQIISFKIMWKCKNILQGFVGDKVNSEDFCGEKPESFSCRTGVVRSSRSNLPLFFHRAECEHWAVRRHGFPSLPFFFWNGHLPGLCCFSFLPPF